MGKIKMFSIEKECEIKSFSNKEINSKVLCMDISDDLLNLLSGASIASTLLQVGYTFLMGGLFSTIMAKTKDIWLIVVIHTIFDIGGTLVNKLGSGIFQDKLFWIFTVVFGVLAGLYILFNIYVLNKKDNESLEPKKEEIQA